MINSPKVFSKNTDRIPETLDGIVTRLETIYPMSGFRGCKTERDFDRYQGAQDVIDQLKQWQRVLASEG